MRKQMYRMTLALPLTLKAELEAIAEAERRSLTKQIVVLLEGASAHRKGNVPATEGALQG